jgi:thiamine-phosphate diphosphorylase
LIVRISRGLTVPGLPEFCRSTVRHGADVIQIREPGLGTQALLILARAAVAAARDSGVRIVVSDRVDVAVIAGAAGVHLRADGPAVSAVRAIVPSGFLIGRSAHDDEEIDRAAGADYLIFGTVFSTASKPGIEGQGLDALKRAVQRFRGPVLAIGGIGPHNAGEVIAAGAAGYAAISAFDL